MARVLTDSVTLEIAIRSIFVLPLNLVSVTRKGTVKFPMTVGGPVNEPLALNVSPVGKLREASVLVPNFVHV